MNDYERSVKLGELLNAITDDDIGVVRELLDKGLVGVNDRQHDSLTSPLSSAAAQGRAKIAEFLIDRGAALDLKDAQGWTPLHRAAMYDQHAAVDLLIKKGATLRLEDNSGMEPLHRAKTPNIKQRLERAIEEGEGHAGRVTGERKDKGPPQVGG